AQAAAERRSLATSLSTRPRPSSGTRLEAFEQTLQSGSPFEDAEGGRGRPDDRVADPPLRGEQRVLQRGREVETGEAEDDGGFDDQAAFEGPIADRWRRYGTFSRCGSTPSPLVCGGCS